MPSAPPSSPSSSSSLFTRLDADSGGALILRARPGSLATAIFMRGTFSIDPEKRLFRAKGVDPLPIPEGPALGAGLPLVFRLADQDGRLRPQSRTILPLPDRRNPALVEAVGTRTSKRADSGEFRSYAFAAWFRHAGFPDSDPPEFVLRTIHEQRTLWNRACAVVNGARGRGDDYEANRAFVEEVFERLGDFNRSLGPKAFRLALKRPEALKGEAPTVVDLLRFAARLDKSAAPAPKPKPFRPGERERAEFASSLAADIRAYAKSRPSDLSALKGVLKNINAVLADLADPEWYLDERAPEAGGPCRCPWCREKKGRWCAGGIRAVSDWELPYLPVARPGAEPRFFEARNAELRGYRSLEEVPAERRAALGLKRLSPAADPETAYKLRPYRWSARSVSERFLARLALRRKEKVAFNKGWPRSKRFGRDEEWSISHAMSKSVGDLEVRHLFGPRGVARGALRLGGRIADPAESGHKEMSPSGRRATKRSLLLAALRLPRPSGAPEGESFSWSFPALMHRDFPRGREGSYRDDALVKQWSVSFRRGRLRLSLALEVRMPKARPVMGPEGRPLKAGIDLGWRKSPEGVRIGSLFVPSAASAGGEHLELTVDFEDSMRPSPLVERSADGWKARLGMSRWGRRRREFDVLVAEGLARWLARGRPTPLESGLESGPDLELESGLDPGRGAEAGWSPDLEAALLDHVHRELARRDKKQGVERSYAERQRSASLVVGERRAMVERMLEILRPDAPLPGGSLPSEPLPSVPGREGPPPVESGLKAEADPKAVPKADPEADPEEPGRRLARRQALLGALCRLPAAPAAADLVEALGPDASFVDSFEDKDRLQSESKRALNRAAALVAAHAGALGIEQRHIRAMGAQRLGSLALDPRLPDEARPAAAGALARHRELADLYARISERVVARRDRAYQNIAKQVFEALGGRVDGVAVEGPGWLGSVVEHTGPSSPVPIRLAAGLRHRLGLSEFARAFANAGQAKGIEVEEVQYAFSTRLHAACGYVNPPSAELAYRCGGCGARIEQDRNAAANLAEYAAGDARLRASLDGLAAAAPEEIEARNAKIVSERRAAAWRAAW